MWTKSKVSLDEGVDFTAFINDERWNGFLCPYFTIEEAEKVVNYINSQNEYPDAVALIFDREGRKVYENMPNGQTVYRRED